MDVIAVRLDFALGFLQYAKIHGNCTRSCKCCAVTAMLG